ncbi:MAG: molecular chaperone DnaJ [Candidatus Wildermuthbacteria bacterium]|nr:molecular chaperone DnaJ [Candidatus Wildermuthbacteria bacterium]
MKDYYKILGIQKNATPEEIKRAYYKLAHQHHPDKGGDEKNFKEINEAYQVLSDASKRTQYDKYGRVFEGAGPGGGGFSGFRWNWGGPGARGEEGTDFNFDFGNIGDIFEDFFGAQGEEQDFRRGEDIEIELQMPLEAVLQAREETITFRKFLACSRCQGKGAEPDSKVRECFSCRGVGKVQQIRRTVLGSFTKEVLCPECKGEGWRPEKACNVCKGEGRIRGEEKIRMRIPSGVDSNQVLKVQGKGDAGRKKGQSGDLYVRIKLKSHPVFERKGDDLHLILPLSFAVLALGDEVEVPTLEGTAFLLKIPAGTESGKVFRIPERGIPRFSRIGRGNMYIQVQLKVPKKISREQKDLLEKLRKEGI